MQFNRGVRGRLLLDAVAAAAHHASPERALHMLAGALVILEETILVHLLWHTEYRTCIRSIALRS